MANYHLNVKMISRHGGKSCVASLAYRSATKLVDQRTGEAWDYTSKPFVGHVAILTPQGAPSWIYEIAEEVKTSRQTALQKFSDIVEAAEKRIDSQVYREVEFSLPNELTNEQNITWAQEFINDVFVQRGMVAVLNFHFDIDSKTGQEKPHCHTLLTTRDLTDDGFRFKNRDWNSRELLEEAREQYAQYQNAALKEHGFDVRVTHLSNEGQGLDIDPQTKRGKKIVEMTTRGFETDKQKIFDMVRLKNQFKIVKNPDIVFSIVTAKHSTFTRQDIAKILHRYIDDSDQFRTLQDRLMDSKELVNLESSSVHLLQEPVYTTRNMLGIELSLVKTAENLSVQKSHGVSSKTVEGVITKHNEKLKEYGGLSSDQQNAIRHMLKADQISCVVGFAGAGKTTCLEAAQEAWEKQGYKTLGLAPTGRAADNMEKSGIRSLTLHKFLILQEQGRERILDKTILVLDEAGMVDSRNFSELLALVEKTGAKIVCMGDGNQLQAVEAGPAFRLLLNRLSPAVLETIVRQQVEWQRDATQLFGTLQTRKALELYQEKGCFTTVQETMPDLANKATLIDFFCLSRQLSGRIWQEMMGDFKSEVGKDPPFDPETDFEGLNKHQDFCLFHDWKNTRHAVVMQIIGTYENQKEELKARGVDIPKLDTLVEKYRSAETPDTAIFKQIETILRQMSYEHITDTRANTRQAMVDQWAKDRQASPHYSHIMLAFSNKDANKLNEDARALMRKEGEITGPNHTFTTKRIDEDDFGKEIVTIQDRSFAKGDRLLFTRNDNNLKVKNGTLGTILEIDKQKLTVALDDGKRTVSFAVNLYPFIDNGWATTIHKAQGMTADIVKMLASFEQYRNLAYVGMTRHRHDLQVFVSKMDFWRPEKILDRLSRVQEKLSGFDYLNAEAMEEKLKEDTAILWHEQKFIQAKDFWRAIKVTGLDVFNKIMDRSPSPKVESTEFLSFDDSEEVRSKDFFATPSNEKSKGAFAKKNTRLNEERGSKAHPHPSPSSSPNEENGQSSPLKAVSQDARKVRIQQSQVSQPFKEQVSTLKKLSSSQIQSSSDQQKDPEKKFVDSLETEDLRKKVKEVRDKINKEYDTKIIIKEKWLSFEEADKQLKERIYELATSLLGEPNRGSRNSAYLRFGELNEFSVGVKGKQQGVYMNFVSGVKGGPLKLIEDQVGLSSPKEALKWASDWLGNQSMVIKQQVINKPQQEAQRPKWKPIVPVPKNQENPDITSKYLNVMLKDGSKEVGRYAYRDAQGNLKGYVIRLEKLNGDKVDKKTPPLAYCEDDKGRRAWKWQAFETENKSLYGLEKLAQDSLKPILVVEGEKTADAAQKILPGYHVVTWSGGVANPHKTDWKPLIGKSVTIWPDNDEAGHKAAKAVQEKLTQLNTENGTKGNVAIVKLPKNTPEKWDLADNLPKGWTLQTILNCLKTSSSEHFKASETTTQQKLDRQILQKQNPVDIERQAFEKSRLEYHQNYCATLGFLDEHRKYAETPKEMSTAYWQGERLTAIEGRLYKETILKEGIIDQKQLVLQARAELLKNQKILEYLKVFGEASDLSKFQIKHFEQQVLFHQDKTGQLPHPDPLDAICHAIKIHGEIKEGATRIALQKTLGQGLETELGAEMGTITRANKKGPHSHDKSSDYQHLIEQQALMAKLKHQERDTSFVSLKMPEIQKEMQKDCAEKLKVFSQKMEAEAKFSRDMQKSQQRGKDLGM